MILHQEYTKEAEQIAINSWKEGLQQRDQITPAEWAQRERWIGQGASPLSQDAAIRYDVRRLPFCEEPMAEAVNSEVQVEVLMWASGLGKALDLDTDIPTPSGWRKMADIQRGDYIFCVDGFPTPVIAATEPISGRECFEVQFSDGTKIVTDAEHKWETSWSKRSGKGPAVGRVRKIYRRIGIRTTCEIADTLKCGKHYGHGVRLAKPIRPTNLQPTIAAYSLGAWLGDGSSDMARLSCGDCDLHEMMALLRADGRSVRSKKYGQKAPEIYLDNSGYKGGPHNPFTSQLRAIRVFQDKHIPESCLFAPLEYRLALLQGLMDTDGTITKEGQCSFSSAKERLAMGVAELLASLGMKCVSKKVIKGCQTGARCTAWQTDFFPQTQVFRLQRKASRVRLSLSNFERRIVGVVKVQSRPVKCIAIAAPSRLYLASRSFIPTHNTETCVNIIGFKIDHSPTNQFVVYPKDESGRKFSRDVLQRMIDSTPSVNRCVVEAKSRDAGNTIGYKRYHGGSIYITSARSASNFRGPRAGLVYCDEIDGFPASAGEEGDPITLAFKRAEGFPESIKLLSGTPTSKNHSSIENWYNRSDKRMWFVPCRRCDRAQVLMWRRRGDIKELQATVDWPKLGRNRHEKAVILCGHCAATHNDAQRLRAIFDGTWKETAQFNGIRGYWLNGLNSTLPPEKGFKSKLHQFAVNAHDAAHSANKRETTRVWTNTFLAETFQEEQDIKTHWSAMLSRRETYAEMSK